MVETRVLLDEITCGVHCGDWAQTGCLSLLRFNIYVMGMVVELERLGVMVDRSWCGALLNADDVVLIVETGVELQEMFDKVGKYVLRWMLKFTDKKSKVLVVDMSDEGMK